MLTSILSAICALALGASTMSKQADTSNVYMVDNVKVANFDGSQLVGKTISDYKVMTSSSTSNGVVSVTKIHMIRTDGKQVKNASCYTTTTLDGLNGKIGSAKITIIGNDVDTESNVSVVTSGKGGVKAIINGKEYGVEGLKKIKPDNIASMTVYKAGSDEAMARTDDKNESVIVITLK